MSDVPYGPSDVGASELAFYLVYITREGVETIVLSIEWSDSMMIWEKTVFPRSRSWPSFRPIKVELFTREWVSEGR